MRNLLILPLLAAAPLAALSWAAPRIHADEWEESTPYYEDDAWYDVSEWLDGNDYNPTDEVIGEWDNETYEVRANEDDADNDAYGYTQDDERDDWMYDYYDDNYATYNRGQNDDAYDYSYRYYDYDNDGYYDAFSSYFDSNGDGVYDDYSYYRFNVKTTPSDKQKFEQQAAKKADSSSKRVAVEGTVKQVKTAKVRGNDHLVAHVDAADQQKTVIVDLGSPKGLSQKAGQNQDQKDQHPVKQGEKLTAHGALVKIGDKQVLMAQKVKLGDSQQEIQVDRDGRELEGKVAKMKTAKIRGQEHQMAIVDLKSGKQILVDLGPTDRLDANLAENDQVKVSGIPVRINDRTALIARSVTKNGEKTKIERVAKKDRAPSGS